MTTSTSDYDVVSDAYQKISVIGNGGGGKTILSRRLSELYKLPLTHVDSIQFLEEMKVRPVEETRKMLNAISDQQSWIIDGFGPIDVMEQRFSVADKIVFVDFPLWRHYWWCTKRQIQSIRNPRSELPDNCNEATLTQTIWLYRTLWRVHKKIRPKLIELFSLPEINHKIVEIKNPTEWDQVFERGLP